MQEFLRIDLNEDGTTTYWRWDEASEDYDFNNPIPPREALKMISNGAEADLTVLDPDNHDRIFEAGDFIRFYEG